MRLPAYIGTTPVYVIVQRHTAFALSCGLSCVDASEPEDWRHAHRRPWAEHLASLGAVGVVNPLDRLLDQAAKPLRHAPHEPQEGEVVGRQHLELQVVGDLQLVIM